MPVLPVGWTLAVLCAGGILLALVPGRDATTPFGGPSRLRPESLARWSGLALGAALAWWASGSETLGRGAVLAPTLFGAGAVLGALGADALTPRPHGRVRFAGLAPRRIRDYLPTRLAALLGGFAVALVVLLTFTTLAGSADDLGRAGRSLTFTCGDMTGSHGPWPGSYYSVPLLAALAAATAGCGLALHRTARRPVTGEPDGGADAGRRRDGTTDVVAAWGLLVTGSLAGVGTFAVGGVHAVPCASAALQAGYWLLLPTVAGAAFTAVYCLAVLVDGTGRRR
ncbi:hypothetical protein [Streptomyces cyslabdanicus]|uniref:hypothetical protein n=1 Tax=Streptomyces cyslabdanicus TaxID=1470456 RepID=UPI004044118B